MLDYRIRPNSGDILQIPDLSDLAAQIFFANEIAFYSLGTLIEKPDASSKDLRHQSKVSLLHFSTIKTRYTSYLINGRDQIFTSFPVKVPEEEFEIIWLRVAWLGKYACINPQIPKLKTASEYVAKRAGLSPRHCQRFILRWLHGGPYALSKSWDPYKLARPASHNGTHGNDKLMDEICDLIINGPWPITKAVNHYSDILEISEKTLWNCLKKFRNPPPPKTKEFKIDLDPHVVKLSRGYLLTHPYSQITVAQKELENIMSKRGIESPNEYKLRRIRKETITDIDIMFIHNLHKRFESEIQVVGHMVINGVIWYMDFTPLNKMVIDNRNSTNKTEARLHVANVVSAPSGYWLYCQVFFDRMNQYEVAETFIDLFMEIGTPDEIRVDGGGELNGETIKKMCAGLNIRHRVSYKPRQNGFVETRNRYVNDRFSRISTDDLTLAKNSQSLFNNRISFIKP